MLRFVTFRLGRRHRLSDGHRLGHLAVAEAARDVEDFEPRRVAAAEPLLERRDREQELGVVVGHVTAVEVQRVRGVAPPVRHGGSPVGRRAERDGTGRGGRAPSFDLPARRGGVASRRMPITVILYTIDNA